MTTDACLTLVPGEQELFGFLLAAFRHDHPELDGERLEQFVAWCQAGLRADPPVATFFASVGVGFQTQEGHRLVFQAQPPPSPMDVLLVQVRGETAGAMRGCRVDVQIAALAWTTFISAEG